MDEVMQPGDEKRVRVFITDIGRLVLVAIISTRRVGDFLFADHFDFPPRTSVASAELLPGHMVKITLHNPSWPVVDGEPPVEKLHLVSNQYRFLTTVCQHCGREENAVVTEGKPK